MVFAVVDKQDRKQVVEFVKQHHYTGKCPNYVFAVRADVDGNLVGVALFGHPASPFVSQSICGERNRALELSRVAFSERIPNAVSQLVAFALSSIEWDGFIVSYADLAQGHSGTVYQALSWRYAGCSKARTDIDAGGKHPRHHLGDTAKRVARSPKHRYWTATGKMKRRLLKESKWESLPYPKCREVWDGP